MPKNQFDLFEQPPLQLSRGYTKEGLSELVSSTVEWEPKDPGSPHYLAAQELVHFTAYLKLSEWQQNYLWPHLKVLLQRIKTETRPDILWFELGYIISAMEIEQIRSRTAALEICKKYGISL